MVSAKSSARAASGDCAARRRFLVQSLWAGGSFAVGWNLAGRSAVSHAAWPAPEDARELLAGVLRRYGRLKALTADFIQVHQGRQTLREQGTLALKRNGRMRWDYAAPNVKQFLCDGKQTYFYSATRQRYTVEPVRASRDPRTPFLFLLGDQRAARLFTRVERAADPPTRAGYVVLRLTPRERIELVTAVLVECHPTNFELTRIALLSATGDRDDFLLSNIVENPVLPESLFEFTPPPGAQRATP
ncbi:MAG: outer-membrane lipoprotein carrier protein LolA [Chloracidobacterium sp.]|uniref:Outer-membrane lipoprotein carrier protein LolA n=1 Tax=Chloracidobacterium validum TaxID=2821543 RepID=A0ABX8BDE7_9BACT|nr:outer membrane lipoprotein carrier protein LolA [Chloracidobacterium validum]QUW03560.1 outer-membrane lipoprotein carrier protein LolA [Chloracidobacterium validum]